ncbi:MAG: transcriptional repressor [Clostridia bacterium]|nr:transcriptional repressor [Clostridia bacterium]
MKQAYHTKQKTAILSCLEAQKSRSLTVERVCDALAAAGEKIGRSTVYRTLESLCAEGKISRYAAEEGRSVTYRFIGSDCEKENHFHLICTECGQICHTHCHELEQLFLHLAADHGFLPDNKKTVIYGVCQNCRKAVRG